MGQMTRINRSCRFIEEFRADIEPTLTLQQGMHLTVKGVSLAYRDGTKEVVAVALLEGFGGTPQVEVELDDGVFFDPEYSGLVLQAEHLAEQFNLEYEDVLRRLEEKVDHPLPA